jgi:plasmid stability protein
LAQLLIRRLDEDVKENLRRRAKRHGVSMEEEARTILRAELLRVEPKQPGLGTQIANLFKDVPDNDEPLPEFPDEPIRYAKFDE